MAYTTINKHTEHFNTLTYTGGSGDTAHTGVGFQPDLVWIKERTRTRNHAWFDVIRGPRYWIGSNSADAQDYNSGAYLVSFDSDGFTTTDTDVVGKNGYTYASWNWKAGGGQGSSNTDGSINTTYTSVNTTAGFSISQWNGNGSSSATIGHGLGVIPKVIISKAISTSAPEGGWFVMHNSIADGENLRLNQTHGQYSTSQFSQGLIKESAATNSVWGFQAGGSGVENVNSNGHTYITYCFAEKTGYSKFGSYIGNGNSNGPFVYTGFKPSLVIYKGFLGSNSSDNWEMIDNKRTNGPVGNPQNEVLYPNLTNAEGVDTTDRMDLLSNGFKMRTNGADYNGNGQSYIYMAFGQSLVGSNNVPATAF